MKLLKKFSLTRALLLGLALLSLAQQSRAGSVVRFFYEGDSTSSSPSAFRQSVSTLTSWPYFPNSPSYREQLDDFYAITGQPLSAGLQGKDNSGQDYGSWVRGYLEAPATGAYYFGIASADNSELWLSTNYLAANKVLIAYEPGTGEVLFSGNRLETRVSAPINLVKGQKYYFEVLHQHGPGTGYIQVGWQRPDGVQEIIPALHLATYEDESAMDTYGGFFDFASSAPAFNNAANTGLRGGYLGGDITNAVSLKEGSELLLPLDVIAAQPTTFVWKTNGVVVPDQNLSYFDIARTPATYNNVQIQAIISNAYGSITSSVAKVTVTPDTVPPTLLTVDTAGNPNLVQVIYSKPVSPLTATNLANYSVTNLSGGALTITNITLSSDQLTVFLSGNFNFQAGTNYLLRVQNIKDQASTGNTLSPNPSTAPFTLSAPLGSTYSFESGLPSNFQVFGNAGVTNNISAPSGSGILRLTDALRNQSGHALITDRRDIDQAHIRFKIRVSDTGASVTTDQPWGDGFSVNISAGLPLGTFSNPQYGYSPNVAAPQLSIFFNNHQDTVSQPAAIGVSLNSGVITNILAGTNGVPSISSADGHWAPVDINIKRDGTLYLAFDGVVLLTNYPTAWVGINSAQVGLAAGTRSWYETHWIDDLYVNFGEGDVGNVGLSPSSVLGGSFPENSTVRLIAVPTGAGPFTYQWYRNGVAVTGGNSRILTFSGVSGSGGNFYVAVSNAFSSAVSSTNVVVIVPDLIPPAVVSARGLAGGVNEVILTFSETLDPLTATTPATYSSPYFVVSSVALGADGKTVTLNTTQQRVGTTYPLSISGLKDASSAGNVLNTNINFVSGLTYRDEILADQPARYFKLDETNSTVAVTQSVQADTANTNGAYANLTGQGVPPLLPSASSNEFAVSFTTNYVTIPNGGDINDFRGPWPKKSFELWFKANSFPIGYQPGDTAVLGQTHAVTGLWEEGGVLRGINLYLWNPVTNSVANTNSPATALLTFHAFISTADGPGAPFGLLNYPAVYVTYPVTTNVTYHVVAVLDGDTAGRNGGLRLYVNSDLVAVVTNGIGLVYNHNSDVQIGRGTGRTHLNVNGIWSTFDGVIDEVSTFNAVLSTNRILAHYRAGVGLSTTPTIDPTLVSSVDPRGNPYRLNVTFNQPVSAATATNLANYALKTSGNVTLPITSAQLGSDLKTVSLNGAFNFAIGSSYNITVANVADILAATNKVASTNLVFTFASAGSVAIAGGSDLGNKSITENQTVQWSVIATGQTPYGYQWRSNGVALAGQTNAALSFAARLNSAANYAVVVNNEFSSVTSSPPAVLTVLPDLIPPQLTGLKALAGTINEIRLTFTEPVDPGTATNLATYSVPTAGSTGLGLLAASLSADGLQVTLKTTAQVHGQTNQLAITNLRDRANTPNTLSITVAFASGISYRDEILAEGTVRYWTFDETSGTAFNTLVSKFDTDPASLVGAIQGSPSLGVASLVPNSGGTAISFSKANTNQGINLPNGRDLNAILGPWAKITHSFAFRANSLPRAFGTTNSEAPAIYGHNSLVIYLQGTQDTNSPTQAQLIFKAQNTTSDGPGSPWGGNTLATAKYISYPIVAGQTYNVVAVLDGNASFTGQLRLYVNGTLVGTATGIGQIYKHQDYPPAFAHSYFTALTGTNYTIVNTLGGNWADVFDGVIDEFSVINSALSTTRIAQLNTFAQTSPAPTGFSIVTPTGTAPTLGVAPGGVNAITLQWPGSGSTGYYLEYSTNLASGLWFSNPASPSLVGGTNTFTQTISNGVRFFRLHKP